MIFLVVLCEGETEMDFVRIVLQPHLIAFGVRVHPILFGKQVRHDTANFAGGVLNYAPVYKHITASLRQYSSDQSRVTTLLDLYAFPTDFPDYEQYASVANPYARVKQLEDAIRVKVNSARFIPNIQLHEFETLVLAKPDEILNEFPGMNVEAEVQALIQNIGDTNPELINQTRDSAPSKRILKHIPGYSKRLMGPSIVGRIGISFLKSKCPHFGKWIDTLENLA